MTWLIRAMVDVSGKVIDFGTYNQWAFLTEDGCKYFLAFNKDVDFNHAIQTLLINYINYEQISIHLECIRQMTT